MSPPKRAFIFALLPAVLAIYALFSISTASPPLPALLHSRGVAALARARAVFSPRGPPRPPAAAPLPAAPFVDINAPFTSSNAAAAASAPAPSPAPFSALSATLLSIDFHISPIWDLKHLLSASFPAARVSDRSLSGACGRPGTCATPATLAVLRQGDVDHSMHLSPGVRREFFGAYAPGGGGGALVAASDAMVCSHPTGMCEVVMPFNRSVFLWATTRFEQGRERSAARFGGFVRNFRAMAALPGSAVLANNMYDAHYVRYFTGLPVTYLPSLCAYPGVKWAGGGGARGGAGPLRVLVHGYRPHRGGVGLDAFIAPLRAAVGGAATFIELRAALGEDYEYQALVDGAAAVLHIPYQVSVMSFFEHYRMGVPLLAPSLELLTRWHMAHGMVSERTWDTVLANAPAGGSVLPRHPDADEPFDPNDEHSEEAVRWWLQWSDFYVFPHVILFDSWEDAAQKLAAVDLTAVSRSMRAFSDEQEAAVKEQWAGLLRGLPSRAERDASDARLAGLTYDQRMDAIYGAGAWAQY
jgi:hypothetical protein